MKEEGPGTTKNKGGRGFCLSATGFGGLALGCDAILKGRRMRSDMGRTGEGSEGKTS